MATSIAIVSEFKKATGKAPPTELIFVNTLEVKMNSIWKEEKYILGV